MFRLWGKLFKNNKILRDIVIYNDDRCLNRTKKVYDAIDKISYEFDLSKPIWLDSNIKDFKRNDKTRFTKDNFIEGIEFDFFEIQVIEEDD